MTSLANSRWLAHAARVGLACALVCAIAVGGFFRSAEAQAPAVSDFKATVRQAILMDAETGAIFFQHNADQLAAPASMSKLMTLAIAFKLMKAGKLKPSDEFVVSVNAWRRGGAPSGTSAMMIPLNTKVRLEELIQGIAVQSGNDAAMVLAEGIAGSEDAFAKLMNEEARRLGMRQAQFRNATGLYHPEHLMTVRELAILARHIMLEYPDYFPVFAQKEFRYRTHRFINRNPLLLADPNVDGMKTGFVRQAGYGVVVTIRQNGRRLIAVVNGAAGENERKEEVRKLFEWASKSVGEFKIYEAGEIIGQARVWGGDAFYVPLVGKGDITVWLPRFPAGQRLRGEIVYASPLKAPVKKGDEVARLRVSSSSSAVQEVPLLAAEDVAEGGLMRRGLDSLAHLALRLVPGSR